jgi:fructosamine-3-kinase
VSVATERSAIQEACQAAGLSGEVVSLDGMSGGCIDHVSRVVLSTDSVVVAKTGDRAALDRFREEAAGLRTLEATGTVRMPTVHAVDVFDGRAVLVMSYLSPGESAATAWRDFGQALAALHDVNPGTGDRYGFETDNHLGSTRQPNGWMDDWVAFNAERRIGHQLRLGTASGVLEPREADRIRRLIDGLDAILPRHPHPSLIHGDLWSGNALPTVDEQGRPCVGLIDPAVSIGDGLADVAMMQLFGGFPAVCFEAYFERRATDEGARVDRRIAVYQLYHVLNHVNLFGRGYARQARSLLDRLGV